MVYQDAPVKTHVPRYLELAKVQGSSLRVKLLHHVHVIIRFHSKILQLKMCQLRLVHTQSSSAYTRAD